MVFKIFFGPHVGSGIPVAASLLFLHDSGILPSFNFEQSTSPAEPLAPRIDAPLVVSAIQNIVVNNFDNYSVLSQNSSISLSKVQALFFPLMILLIGVSNIIVIYTGGNQYIEGKIEIGVIAEFIISA